MSTQNGQEHGSGPHYPNGEPVHAGDRVDMAGCGAMTRHFGTVVFVIERREYLHGFDEASWSYLNCGFMVQDDSGTLFHFAESDSCTVLLSRHAFA